MINSCELRQNNYVREIATGEVFQVNDVGLTGVGVFNKDRSDWLTCDEIEPIYLTNDVLDKLGTRKHTYSSTEPHWIIGTFLYGKSDHHITNGLHWLQNHHFFKTQDELQLTFWE